MNEVALSETPNKKDYIFYGLDRLAIYVQRKNYYRN